MVKLQSYSTHRRNYPSHNATPPAANGTQPFQEWLPDPTSNDGWAIETLTLRRAHEDNGLNVANAIKEGKGQAVCDGSYNPESNTGAAAFVLHGDDPHK